MSLSFPRVRRTARLLTYNKHLIALARALGLTRLLRGWYYAIAKPRDGILSLQCRGVTAQFQVHTAEELRVLESFAGGEQQVLAELLERIPSGAVVYDIGANVGLYSVFLAKTVGDQGRVVSFEPDPQNHAHLMGNVASNLLSHVTCVQKALGDQRGEGKLVQGDIIGNYSLVAHHTSDTLGASVPIAVGDELAAELSLPVPYLVKIDVEGFEYSVIQGLRRTLGDEHCHMVCIEVHPYLLPDGVSADRVVGALRGAGFNHEKAFQRPKDFHLIMWKERQCIDA